MVMHTKLKIALYFCTKPIQNALTHTKLQSTNSALYRHTNCRKHTKLPIKSRQYSYKANHCNLVTQVVQQALFFLLSGFPWNHK